MIALHLPIRANQTHGAAMSDLISPPPPDADANPPDEGDVAGMMRRQSRALMHVNAKLGELLERVGRIEQASKSATAPATPAASSAGEWLGFELLADAIDGLDRAVASLRGTPAPMADTLTAFREHLAAVEKNAPPAPRENESLSPPASPAPKRPWWAFWRAEPTPHAAAESTVSVSSGELVATFADAWVIAESHAEALAEAANAAQITAAAVADGLANLTRRLLDALDRQGIEAVASAGEFDPRWHQAIAVEAGPENAIVRTERRGYARRDAAGTLTPIRPALVVVGRAPYANTNTADAGGVK